MAAIILRLERGRFVKGTERAETCVRELEAVLVPEVMGELGDAALRVMENRIPTVADHLAVELRRRLYPHAFANGVR